MNFIKPFIIKRYIIILPRLREKLTGFKNTFYTTFVSGFSHVSFIFPFVSQTYLCSQKKLYMKNKYKYTTLERTGESLTRINFINEKFLQSYGHIKVKIGT